MLRRPDLRLKIVENRAETLSIAIRKRGEIFLKMSRASNNRCRFCNDAPFQDGTFWPFEAMTAMIDEGLAQGVKRVFLSGGEPTIHPRFLDVIAYARRRGAERVTCITNGRLFSYEQFARKAVRLGLTEAFVALLGADAATHDGLTEVEGSFEQTTAGIRHLIRLGARVHLSTVVNRLNMAQVADILTLIPGVTGLTAVRVSPGGRALFESLDDLGIEVEEARPHLARARREAEARGLELRPKLFPADFYEGIERDYTHHEEYLPEIKDTELRTGLFGRYARGEGDVACRGEACRVCYRKPYCDALYGFRERLLSGSHPVVRCDLDDARQRALLPRLLGARRLWVRARRADTVLAALRELGIERAPELLQADALGDGVAPATAWLLLPDSARVGDPERLAAAEHVALLSTSFAAALDPALARRAEAIVVAPLERFRDQARSGAPAPQDVLARGLPVAGLPPCLARERLVLASPEDVLELGALADATTLDVVGFTHHWLTNLDRTKSTRCSTCARSAECAGLHVNQARHWGLQVLEPIEDGAA